MRRKTFEYWDLKIYHPKDGRIYYLRHKKNRRSNEITVTVRTQKNGKGVAKTKPVSSIILSEKTYKEVWHVIHKKFKFQFVNFTDIPEL